MKATFSSSCAWIFPASTRTSRLRLGLGCALLLAGCAKAPEPAMPVAADTDHVEEWYPFRSGTPVTVNLQGEKFTYQRINGENILDGDMILTDEQVDPTQPATEGAWRDNHRWNRGVVYYTIDPNFANPAGLNAAMGHWFTKTNGLIKFKRRTNEADYVTFRNSFIASSNVGRVGGQQFVTLPARASIGNMIHEIGHAVGLYHEHQRQDRNEHIKVFEENIEVDALTQFDRYPILFGTDHGAFDFNSIMLYSSDAFSKNGNATMLKKNGIKFDFFKAQRQGLSVGDVATVVDKYDNLH